jgi:hypothetical protein
MSEGFPPLAPFLVEGRFPFRVDLSHLNNAQFEYNARFPYSPAEFRSTIPGCRFNVFDNGAFVILTQTKGQIREMVRACEPLVRACAVDPPP